jgi:hypothetical protein
MNKVSASEAPRTAVFSIGRALRLFGVLAIVVLPIAAMAGKLALPCFALFGIGLLGAWGMHLILRANDRQRDRCEDGMREGH